MEGEGGAGAAYRRKLEEMRGYLPFLERTMARLEKAAAALGGAAAQDPQLGKMRSLHRVLAYPDKRLRLDTLYKCEEVLRRLHEKVEGSDRPPPPALEDPPSRRLQNVQIRRSPSHPTTKKVTPRSPTSYPPKRAPRSPTPPTAKNIATTPRSPTPTGAKRVATTPRSPTPPAVKRLTTTPRSPSPSASDIQRSPSPPLAYKRQTADHRRGHRGRGTGGRRSGEGPKAAPWANRNQPLNRPPPFANPWTGPPRNLGGPEASWTNRPSPWADGGPPFQGPHNMSPFIRGDNDGFPQHQVRFCGPPQDERQPFGFQRPPLPSSQGGFDRFEPQPRDDRFEPRRFNFREEPSEGPGQLRHPSPLFRSNNTFRDDFRRRQLEEGNGGAPNNRFWSRRPLDQQEMEEDNIRFHEAMMEEERARQDLDSQWPSQYQRRNSQEPREFQGNFGQDSSSQFEFPKSQQNVGSRSSWSNKAKTPQSPKDTPASPLANRVKTPQSPESTPASPRSNMVQTPQSPEDTPASPPHSPVPEEQLHPPKVIPLEKLKTIPLERTKSGPERRLTDSSWSQFSGRTKASAPPGPCQQDQQQQHMDFQSRLPAPCPRGGLGLLPTPPMMPPPRPERPTLLEPKRPSTYGEYRRLRDRQMREQQQQILKKQQEEDLHSFGTSEEKKNHMVAADPEAISKFKIPKKKKQVEEKSEQQQELPVRKESTSDSENELKIVDDEQEEEKVEDVNNVYGAEDVAEPEGKSEEEKVEDAKSNFLQSLVATLEPEEASKIQKKAKSLQKDEKLSLKQLKFLLLDDSDEEKKKEEKPTKPREKKKPQARKPPTPGVRRSSRLNQIDQPQTESTKELEASDDDDEAQLVIDEESSSNNQVKTQESHPDEVAVVVDPQSPGAPVVHEAPDVPDAPNVPEAHNIPEAHNVSEAHNVPEAHDVPEAHNVPEAHDVPEAPEASETTSQNLPAPVEPKKGPRRGRGRPRKAAVVPTIQDDSVSSTQKEEEDDNKAATEEIQEAKEDLLPRTRSGHKRGTSPKTKTSTTVGFTFAFSKTASLGPKDEEDLPAPKKEPKDPDLKVFLGSEDLVLENQFKTKEAQFGIKVEKVSQSLLHKLEAFHQQEETISIEKPQIVEKETEKCVDEEDFGPFVITQEPDQYSQGISSMIANLKTKVEFVPDENLDLKLNECQKIDLLALVRQWKHKGQHQSEQRDHQLQLDMYTRHKLSHNCSAPITSKSAPALAAQLSLERICRLFKCYSSDCAFASDNYKEFVSHIDKEHHNDSSGGWRRCVYCNLAFMCAEKLALHIVAIHSLCCYQCPLCYHRTGSQIALLIHQQSLHEGPPAGFIRCRAVKAQSLPVAPLTAQMKCRYCKFQTANASQLAAHMKSAHGADGLTEIVCWHCRSGFDRVPLLVLHSCLMHTSDPVICGVRHIEDDESPLSEDDEDFSAEEEEESIAPATSGLSGSRLYRCGNCKFSAPDLSGFSNHLNVCQTQTGGSLSCAHCERQLKHLPTLLEHLKTHGVHRYQCSLCSYRSPLPAPLKAHLRSAHRVSYSKLVPRDEGKTNPDTDEFVMVPRFAIPKSMGKNNTFSPSDINRVPQTAMFRVPAHCSECDFATRVRNNLLKHLRLHKKKGSDGNSEIPSLTPINVPSILDPNSEKATKMSTLLDCDNEEDKKPISDADLAVMPTLVPETSRFACCEPDCQYFTIDSVMLVYHIQALHANREFYSCPHCRKSQRDYSGGGDPGDLDEIPFDDLEFHLRCHGELLFKCGHCRYYHWQKRTAERHVAEQHPAKKQFVRDVRAEVLVKEEVKRREREPVKKNVEEPEKPIQYLPFKCGLCDFAGESLELVKAHCASVHGVRSAFKCALCPFTSNDRGEMAAHEHRNFVRSFFIDQTSNVGLDEEDRKPLWTRNSEGLKHIRGILYEDEEVKPTTDEGEQGTKRRSLSDDDEVDNFPMSCKKCGLVKKTIKGLKMHIKLLHLRTGKFRCKRCQFSANILSSIHTHYKIQHPEVCGSPDFEERSSNDAQVFSHDFWKSNWGIPTLAERKSMVANKKDAEESEDPAESPQAKKGKKKSVKRKSTTAAGGSRTKEIKMEAFDHSKEKLEIVDQTLDASKEKLGTSKTKLEISPFESTPTYKCSCCPKRSQSEERILRHLMEEHSLSSPSDYKVLTRDQVVDLITGVAATVDDFQCFFCDDVVGDILFLQAHFTSTHAGETFKVLRGLGRFTGYLECQLCGHLTPGFERSKQKVHFHEEHPLEDVVNASKYVCSSPSSSAASLASRTSVVGDLSKFNGVCEMRCPRDGCGFSARTAVAACGHLRRHTQTYKCGHCGKTHRTSSEFHQHSAMMHGDKIPDLVKDPEAEAEFEALKGLMEAQCAQEENRVRPGKISTARKSTSRMNIARKSSNGGVQPFSMYGLPFDPVDLSEITTRMTIGGMEMVVSASKMGEFLNLQPRLRIKKWREELSK